MKTILGLGLILFLVISLSIEFYSAQVMADPDLDSDLAAAVGADAADLFVATFSVRHGESLNLATDPVADVIPPLFTVTQLESENDHVVINEVESDPQGDDDFVEEWVELYNPTTSAVDISGWTLLPTHGETTPISIPSGTILAAGAYYVRGSLSQWLDNEDESVILRDSGGTEVDSTPTQNDNSNNDLSWQRYPDGEDTWIFKQSTPNSSNGRDETPPVISIQSPENGQFYPESSVSLTFSVDEATVWIGYSLDGGANATISGNTILDGLSDGEHQVIVYAEDSSGNVGASDLVYFSVDTISPTISVLSPENRTYNVTALDLTFTIDETASWIGYSLDREQTIEVDGNTTLTNLSEGPHTIVVYARDLAGNMGTSDLVGFSVQVPAADTTPPAITISSPQNITYSTSSVLLSFSINEGTSWIDYSLDGMPNQTITGNIILNGLSDGEHHVIVYAEDSSGNVGASDTVYFSVDTNLPPVADAGDPPSSPVDIGEAISFDASNSSDSDGTIVQYYWDMGDGTIYNTTASSVTHSYSSSGVYTITLTVTDDDGATNTTTITVIVANQLPNASFTFSPMSLGVDETVTFDASGSSDAEGPIEGYSWTFGDGNTATGVTVSHVYADNGVYSVMLTVTDNDGATDSAQATVTVANNQPIASFTATPETAKTGEPISFDASASYDPDGTIVSYEWDFRDGTEATGVSTQHVYSQDGIYPVTLTVTDNDGATDTTAITVTSVQNLPPVADAGGPYTGTEGESISFDGGSSYDDNGNVVSYRWNFDDGDSSTGQNPTHTYSQDGTYAVTLTVTDDDGATDTDTTTATVTPNHHPVASFTLSPDSPEVNETVAFNASSSSDPGGTIEDYAWDFGDRNNGTGLTASHSYSSVGIYTVTLTVTDNDGLTDTATRDVTVTPPDGRNETDVTSPEPKAGNNQTVKAESAVTFDASASTDNLGIISYEWDFGDGTTGAGVTATHTYEKPGTYTVTLTVEDEAGNRGTDVCTITVERTEDGEQEPIPLFYVAIVALGGTAAVAASAAVVQATISAVPKFAIPNWLKEFLQLYGGDIFEILNKTELARREEAPLISKRELASISISAVIMTIVFCFVETNGLPHFLNPWVLADVLPCVLIAVVMENFVEVFAEALCARMCRVYKQVRLWLYGLVLFLISSLVFRFPIGSTLITRYQSEKISERKEALIVLSKLLILLTLSIPFSVLYILGFEILGDTGLLVTLMTVFYYFTPLKPIVGKVVFDYQKVVSLLAVVLTGILFFSFAFSLLPHTVYLVAGVISLVLVVISLYLLSKSPSETTKQQQIRDSPKG